MQIHALVAGTDLPAIREARDDRGLDGRIDIRILEHDEGCFAAQFQTHDLQILRACGIDFPPRAHAARHGDRSLKGERTRASPTVRPSPVTTLSTPLRQSRPLGESGNLDGGQGSGLMALHDDGVACDKGRTDLAGRQGGRVVPSRQADNHAEGHAADPDILVRMVRWEKIALDASRVLGRIGEKRHDGVDLALGLVQGLSLFEHHDACEMRLLPADGRGKIGDVAGAHDGWQSGPGRLGTVGGLQGSRRIVHRAGRNGCEHRLVRRILDFQSTRRLTIRPGSIDIHLIVGHIFRVTGCGRSGHREPPTQDAPGRGKAEPGPVVPADGVTRVSSELAQAEQRQTKRRFSIYLVRPKLR